MMRSSTLAWLAALMLVAQTLTGAAHARDAATGAAGDASKQRLLLGLDTFNYVDARWGAAREITVYAHVPEVCRTAVASCGVLIAMHGASRDARRTREVWAAHASDSRVMVFAPHFDAERFKTAWYQQGGIAVAATRDETAFAVVVRLFEHIRERFGLPQTQFAIYGHSAGGQFVQRMHLLQPSPRVSLYMAANPGYYTLPEWRSNKTEFKYPYSISDQKDSAAMAKAALTRPFTLLLGDKDNDPKHFQLNTSQGAMAQGPHRLARGDFFMSQSRAIAKDAGVSLAWQSVVVPGVDHDNVGMARAAAPRINPLLVKQ
jgi:poly(3-hydroxybutyrate) depolymerase